MYIMISLTLTFPYFHGLFFPSVHDITICINKFAQHTSKDEIMNEFQSFLN